tara:strand:+ start:3718 stop:5187 length:1470 start_codon:yes stop_codon:yes gene_type:complete
VWQSIYIYDAHHWGLMAANASDFLNNKIPYKEIFIQYGLFTTIIHSIFMKIGNESVISIFFFTSFIYSISIYYFFSIVRNKFGDSLALFAIICLILIHPFVNHPWHNYLNFFFLIMSIFFLEKNKNIYSFISGIFFGLAVLTYEKLIIIFTFFLISYAITNFNNKKNNKNLIFLLIGFAIPISLFFLYLNINQSYSYWIKYLSIGGIYLDDNYIFVILNFIKNLFQLSLEKFATEPYWAFFSMLLLLNIVFICFSIFKKKFLKQNEKYLIYISMISISSFSTAIHSLNSFRLATGSIFGIFILIYFLNKIINVDTKKIISISIILILCLGINFKKSENNKLFITPVSFEHYPNDKIKYFKNMRFKNDTWNHIIFFDEKINQIKSKCSTVNFAINYTDNAYYYLLFSNVFKTFQIKPWIIKNDTADNLTMKLINPNLDTFLQKKIINNEIIIVSNTTYKVPKNYSFINLPYSYNNKNKRILIPKKCKKNI